MMRRLNDSFLAPTGAQGVKMSVDHHLQMSVDHHLQVAHYAQTLVDHHLQLTLKKSKGHFWGYFKG